LEQPGYLYRSRAWCDLQDLDLGAAAFLLEFGEVSGLTSITVPAREAVIGLALYWRPTPYERPSTMLDVD
jgi:hypothetical protein